MHEEFDNKLEYWFGSLRITNPNTLKRWKDLGKYQQLINAGYIYAEGCGRFRSFVCPCRKCKKHNKT